MSNEKFEILLIEDEIAHAKLVQRALRNSERPFELTVIPTLGEALVRIGESKPNLVILDLLLPDGNGIDLLTEIGRDAPFPVIVLTSHGDEKTAVEAMKHGALDYVVKSEATLGGMLHVIERALREWSHIAQRKHAEDALMSSERRYRSVVEASSEAIIGLTTDSVVQTWNSAAQRIFGYTVDEMIGQETSRLIPPERTSEARQLYRRVKNGQSVLGFETQRLSKDGRLLDVVLSLTPMLDETGEISGVSAIVHDITAQKQAENELRQREAELAHMSRVSTMGEMATALAHELNQPLGVVATYAGGCAEMLENDKVDLAELLSVLKQIHGQTMRAGKIIQHVKAFVAKTKPRRSSTDLNELIREAVQFIPDKKKRQPKSIRFDLDDGLPLIRVDRIQFQQVLVNLLCNAFEAMEDVDPEHCEVVIRTTMNGAVSEVSVSDRGRGLTPEQCEQVFEPYYTTKRDGIGMGLSICRTIIGAHDGRMWVTGNRGNGCTLHFTLPIEAQRQAESRHLVESSKPAIIN